MKANATKIALIIELQCDRLIDIARAGVLVESQIELLERLTKIDKLNRLNQEMVAAVTGEPTKITNDELLSHLRAARDKNHKAPRDEQLFPPKGPGGPHTNVSGDPVKKSG